MGPLDGSTLPAARRDGFYRDSDGVHVLTRHLTFFGLMLDDEAPSEPRDLAGVVADDGLTLRWIPGTDSSGQLGNVVLFVNGEPYRNFGPTELEAKLGAFAAGDTRTFTLVQLDAAGNTSRQTRALRAVPQLTGKSLDEATAALGAAGFALGRVLEEPIATVVPGTVVGPADLKLALESSAIDLVVARGVASPETKLVFSVAGSKKLTVDEDDDDRRPDQGLAAGERHRHAVHREEAAPLHVAAEGQGRRERRQAAAADADPAAGHLQPHLGRALRHGDDPAHRQGDARRPQARAGEAEARGDRGRARGRAAGEGRCSSRASSGTGARIVATATPDQTFALTASAGAQHRRRRRRRRRLRARLRLRPADGLPVAAPDRDRARARNADARRAGRRRAGAPAQHARQAAGEGDRRRLRALEAPPAPRRRRRRPRAPRRARAAARARRSGPSPSRRASRPAARRRAPRRASPSRRRARRRAPRSPRRRAGSRRRGSCRRRA